MAENKQNPVTVLGLGAMGQALAVAFLKTGRSTVVWNRTPGKDADLVAAGAVGAATVDEAVRAGEVIVVVLLDHASVHAALDPVAERLSGKQVINLTSTAPEEARELGRWAEQHGIDYLDGGIMAVPPMIGQPGASILYSGSRKVFDDNRELLESAAAADYFGEDAGLASTWDFALLSSMYGMFAGFLHGAALARSAGASVSAFAERATAWVTAMAQLIPEYGRIIDGGDYTTDVQHLNFHKAAMDAIVRASRDAGVALDVIGPIKNLIDRQVADGHGALAFERTFEELR
ncbi:NAD(P)-dependent oxidoreductase [Nocardia amikacinitolerans]|uniref:NAD(P)-dependent oxidoreductase n=1 Tax=Nocardia amikacinitolerans TaxID=756689 RepID=UPI0020A591B9|nr:NAD(P)-binding domain-containing protein [Nocardia amikacinitolerans]MCP2276166.1 3-hydroxyisobutyrate dehydrogenase [Nocardia amikacinitolerans]MCP2294437.1 3-hydroxyisobutyrate dehydrogenase [Nocardia amikacinitolerans]